MLHCRATHSHNRSKRLSILDCDPLVRINTRSFSFSCQLVCTKKKKKKKRFDSLRDFVARVIATRYSFLLIA